MKLTIKNIGLAAVWATGMVLLACNKPKDIVLENEGTLYMATAFEEKAKFTLFLADTAQYVSFGAAYSGLGFPSSDIPVTFTVQQALVSSFNLENGTDYELLPQASYTIDALTSVIRAGKTTSEPLTLSIMTNVLDRSKKYMLPIKLENVSGGKMSEDMSITYFRLEGIVRRETDITDLANLSVAKDNNGGPGHGEGSPKLVDGSVDTKFLVNSFPEDFWIQLAFGEGKIVNAYTMSSANDAQGRDPKTWRFMGSNDGTNWTLLDTRVDEVFPLRKQTVFYEFENSQAFRFYRLYIDALYSNPIGSLYQQAEFRLITFY